jgi:integrase
MALTDTKLRTLKPKVKPYQIADGGGLFIEVMPGSKRVWRLRYRLNGKQEKVTLGEYPVISLVEARKSREEAKAAIHKGDSPMKAKREAKVLEREPDTVEAFARCYLSEVVGEGEGTSYASNIQRVLKRDILPYIGGKRLSDVNAGDVLALCDRIKDRGAHQSALLARNVVKRLYDYAIARQKVSHNPAAQVAGRYIATAKPRDRALSGEEIGELLKALTLSRAHPAHRLAIHLLLITLVRKGELIGAKWEEIDFDKAEWVIPGNRMKKDKPHVVYLSRQALSAFEGLKLLACGSEYVFPSRDGLDKPIHKTTLNVALRALGFSDFTLHDFRRTASTHLHEAGFNSDWIEKALAHEQKGIRGVYNKAEYAESRRKMLQWWADFVNAHVEEGHKVVIGRFGR